MKMKLLFIACMLATTLRVGVSWHFTLEEVEMFNNVNLVEIKPQKDLKKECSDVVVQMSDCVAFMSESNGTYKPTPSCCKGLKEVVDVDFKCICFTLEYAPSMGIPINMSRAEVMPSLCRLNTPPLTSCNTTAPVKPSPPTTPAPPLSSAAPPPVYPSPHRQTPAPATPPKPPSKPVTRPSTAAPPTKAAEAPAPSGAMHIQMPFLVSSAAVIVLCLMISNHV